MRIGFFGGSFDPPHNGHLAVAKAATAEFSLGRVLLAPTALQPLKPEGAVTSYDDRLAMVELICGLATQMEASRLDSPRDGANYTVDTLELLRASLNESDSIFVIVGVDAFLELHRWRSPERLLDLAEWIVVSRPGRSLALVDKMTLSDEQRLRVHPLEGVAEPASATEIRQRLRSGEDCSELLPEVILKYIREHHLYGTTE